MQVRLDIRDLKFLQIHKKKQIHLSLLNKDTFNIYIISFFFNTLL